MSKKKFSYLLQKYLDDQCSEQENKLVESWFSLLDDEERWERFDKANLKAIEQKLWDRLQSSIHTDKVHQMAPVAEKKVFRLQPIWRAAAVIIFLFVSGAVIYQRTSRSPQAPVAENGWVKKVNGTGNTLALTLEDGSVLQLAKG
ncbi:MAG TPA: hypothetical protein VM871_02985, partial [Flavisolibacter sp.]|nr:hypothetical protein [Flavisolibacter sp.]